MFCMLLSGIFMAFDGYMLFFAGILIGCRILSPSIFFFFGFSFWIGLFRLNMCTQSYGFSFFCEANFGGRFMEKFLFWEIIWLSYLDVDV